MDFLWVVGFYEGEGSTWSVNGGNPQVCFYQKDKDILDKIQKFLGLGKVHSKYRPNAVCKIMWALQIGGSDGRDLLLKMLPHIQSIGKQTQAREVISKIRSNLRQYRRSSTKVLDKQ